MAVGKLKGDVISDLRAEAARLRTQGSKLRAWVEHQAGVHHVSVHTIYRAIEHVGGRTRKTRSDAGTMKAIEAKDMADIAALVVKHDFEAELALDTINAARELDGRPLCEVHVDTVRFHLRRLGVSRSQNAVDQRIHYRWEAPYPNALWQMDDTVAASWYIDVNDTIGFEQPMALTKNKAGNGKPRIWLLVIVDDHSRVRWGRFYGAPDGSSWRDMLLRAMRKGSFGPAHLWPACGVPELLYTDQGPAMKAIESLNLMRALGTELKMPPPSSKEFTHAQAKGKVERAAGILLHGFETASRARRFTRLSVMNEAMEDYLLWLNNKPHAETHEVPLERWVRPHQGHPIRIVPDAAILRARTARQDEVTVSNALTIRLAGQKYQLPSHAPFTSLVNAKVEVRYFAADLSTIAIVIDGQAHEIAAIQAVPLVAGEFKAAPQTPAEIAKRAALATDTTHLDAGIDGVWKHRLRRQGERLYPVRPEEQEHPLDAAAAMPVMLRRVRATERMQAAGVVSTPPTPAEALAIDTLFGDATDIPETNLTAWIATRRGDDAAQAPRALSLA